MNNFKTVLLLVSTLFLEFDFSFSVGTKYTNKEECISNVLSYCTKDEINSKTSNALDRVQTAISNVLSYCTENEYNLNTPTALDCVQTAIYKYNKNDADISEPMHKFFEEMVFGSMVIKDGIRSYQRFCKGQLTEYKPSKTIFKTQADVVLCQGQLKTIPVADDLIGAIAIVKYVFFELDKSGVNDNNFKKHYIDYILNYIEVKGNVNVAPLKYCDQFPKSTEASTSNLRQKKVD